MMIKLQYGNEVIALPGEAVSRMTQATAEDLRVLMAVCADRQCREDMSALAAAAGCSEGQAQASVAFWRGAGVLTAEDAAPAVCDDAAENRTAPVTVSVPTVRHTDSIPRYTTEELSDLLERRRETAVLIDECQQVLGRILNVREIGILVGLLDYLALDGEYLILLCAHCAALGKTSIHYVEKVAQDMVAGGACTVEALQETLRREDAAREAESQIRALFGAQDRKLSQTERKYIHRWTEEWHFEMGMIELAYEATVDTIGEASMRYTDGILKRWQSEGLTTPEAVAESDERHRQVVERENANRAAGKGKSEGKGKNSAQGGSFDVDDFFEAALKRSYQDM